MLDFLSKTPSMTPTDEVASDEQKAKAERIDWHRRNVRNGPVKFRQPGPSDEKRQRRLALRRQTKKAERAQRKQHFAQTREHALLRGQLQRVGVIAYETDFQPSGQDRMQAVAWLIHRFVEISDLEEIELEDALRLAVQRAFDRFSDLSGVKRSEVEYA